MEDNKIIDLYWARDDAAVVETSIKYGGICHGVAMGILHNRQDAEECVNDTWVRAWQTIPPERPNAFKAFLCRITRNLSIDRYRQNQRRAKHIDMEQILDELAECIPDREEVGFGDTLNTFLDGLEPLERKLFLGRYWHACSVKALAATYGLTPNHVSVRLHRTREHLRKYLTERGYKS
ncbi:MAG: sigma-70 family RNA polymerase sigma factor [Ruminococcaceae bacterium]|nr:sigma-70 family RNA polymerase sigma factor [Oscillospiraceae bacterium]